MEKDLGWKPIPLFDREHREDIASMQVNAISMLQSQISMLQLKCLLGLGPSDESGAPNFSFYQSTYGIGIFLASLTNNNRSRLNII